MVKNIEHIKNLIKEIPTNLFLKDVECRYVFSEYYWDHLKHNNDKDWSIVGKTDLEIRKDKKNAQIAYEEDKKIIKTGKGCRYVIEEEYDGKTDYLEIIKNPVRNENNEIIGIVGLINNITEVYFEMNNYNKDVSSDFMTGLYNKNGFLHHADGFVTMSEKRGKIPFIILISCVFPDEGNNYKVDSMILASNTLRLPVAEDKICARIAGEVFAIAKSFYKEEDVEEYVREIENRIQKLISAFYSHDVKFVCKWHKMDNDTNMLFDELYNSVAIETKMISMENSL